MERVTGVEPASSGWKPDIITAILHPHFYIAYYVGGESCNNTVILYSHKIPGAGIQPARPYGHKILSLACLAVPPPGHIFFFAKR
jgi:hypothetical protein